MTFALVGAISLATCLFASFMSINFAILYWHLIFSAGRSYHKHYMLKTGFAMITLSRQLNEKRNNNNSRAYYSSYVHSHDDQLVLCAACETSWLLRKSGGLRFTNTTNPNWFRSEIHTKIICIQLRSDAWSFARQIIVHTYLSLTNRAVDAVKLARWHTFNRI